MSGLGFIEHWTELLGTPWLEIAGKDCEITLEPRPTYCDRGNWIAKLHPRGPLALEIDGADGWPRYYFDRERALLEIEAWLCKRGQLPVTTLDTGA